MCSKRRFTKKEAQGALNANKKRSWQGRDFNRKARRECRAYQCPDCNHWHLSSRP